MKLFYIVLLSLVLRTLNSEAALVWGNSGAITNERGVTVASSETDSGIGSFAQLIWAGANETADPFVRSDTGVSGDDAVVATVFSAEDFFSAPMPGIFPMRVALGAADSNKVYYVRVFNAPNPDYAAGIAASAPLHATYFWQSDTHAYAHNELLDDHWNFAPFGGQTLARGMIASNDVPVWWLVQYDLTNDYDAAAVGNQDIDPLTTDEEWIADTSPIDSSSCFRVTSVTYSPSAAVHFNSSTGRLYTMQCVTLLPESNWTNVPGCGPRPGAGGADSMPDTNAAPAGSFYRLSVQLP
ncbi:MAG TPA: hypothetical protein PKM67_09325 [Kiritimatiellia bacterium]|nr:hypothetical protein [Kiritimatiellia bacterium]HNS81642.1 hypothetical protein [Kiritimatiellia bacterium]HPA78811.1 hypothetical protein [Kiritimatiellia bacterium]HQQ04042.1 hypothetical protein [Kiritimatiellia bacterium]